MNKFVWKSCILLIILLSACNKYIYISPITEKKLPASCESLIVDVKNNWKKHKRKNIYSYDGNYVFELITFKEDCIKELNKEEVGNTWGTPSFIEDNKLFYYLNEDCLNIDYETCSCLYFVYKDNNIIDVGYETRKNID